MATPTYDLLDSTTLSSSASSVSFTSIDQSYRDLVLVINATNTTATNRAVYMQLNNDTGSNYSVVSMNGNGSSASSGSGTSTSFQLDFGSAFLNDEPFLAVANLMDYSATDKHKTMLDRANNPVDGVVAHAQRWANTSAVTEIDLFPNADAFASGSTFHLYGIAS